MHPARPSVQQEIHRELQCKEEEIFETYYQKLNQPTNCDLQCEDECLECFSSKQCEEPQEEISEDDETIILIDVFEEEVDEEELEPTSGDALIISSMIPLRKAIVCWH